MEAQGCGYRGRKKETVQGGGGEGKGQTRGSRPGRLKTRPTSAKGPDRPKKKGASPGGGEHRRERKGAGEC